MGSSEDNSVAFKVLMVGAPKVGRTALIVRMITDRFIGEYLSGNDKRYKHFVKKPHGGVLNCWIQDTCEETNGILETSPLTLWADVVLIVYSITDRASFEAAQELKEKITSSQHKEQHVTALIGTKCDLVHNREVSFQEGEQIATDWGGLFLETSAAEYQVRQRSERNLALQYVNDLSSLIYALAKEQRGEPATPKVSPKPKKSSKNFFRHAFQSFVKPRSKSDTKLSVQATTRAATWHSGQGRGQGGSSHANTSASARGSSLRIEI